MEGLALEKHAEAAYTEVSAEIGRRDLREFALRAWTIVDPQPLIWSWGLDAICDHLYYVWIGDIQNLIINCPPRFTKSLLTCVFFPAWAWIDKPEVQFLTASYDKDLAIRDAVKTRHLFSSTWYRERWGRSFTLMYDVNQQDRYMNDHRGHRVSVSPGARATGEGGNILIFDDPHNVIEAESDTRRQSTINWHDNAWRSRRNNPAQDKRIYAGQRTHDADLFGHLLNQAPDEYEVLRLPAEFDRRNRCITYANPKGEGPDKSKKLFSDPRKEDGELLNPKRLSAAFLRQQRNAMREDQYFSQYQQDTMAGGGFILKAKWWREWTFAKGHPKYEEGQKRLRAGRLPRPMPEFTEIVQSYDTALDEEDVETNSYNARTTWGLFWHQVEWWDATMKQMIVEPEPRLCAMILERWYERCSYPDLRKEMKRSNKEWEPDTILIEKKASGFGLLQEGRRAGLPVRGVKIEGGRKARDKIARAHLVSIVLQQGMVYYVPRKWFFQVRDLCAKFPNVEFYDLVDTVTQALAYLRKREILELPDDPKADLAKLYTETPKRRMGYG